jgi:hypothetical protein
MQDHGGSALMRARLLLHCRFAGIDPNDRGNDAATALWDSMANGQVVLVTTEPLGGGPPVRSVFFVTEGDSAKAVAAVAIIAAMMAPNERVEAYGPLPEVAVKALGLKPGDFTQGRPAPGDTKTGLLR